MGSAKAKPINRVRGGDGYRFRLRSRSVG